MSYTYGSFRTHFLCTIMLLLLYSSQKDIFSRYILFDIFVNSKPFQRGNISKCYTCHTAFQKCIKDATLNHRRLKLKHTNTVLSRTTTNSSAGNCKYAACTFIY